MKAYPKKIIETFFKVSPVSLEVISGINKNLICENGWTSNFLGYSTSEYKKLSTNFFEDIVHPDDRSSQLNAYEAFKENKLIPYQEFVVRALNKAGNYAQLQVRVTPMELDQKGRVTKFLAITKDISEAMELQSKIQRQVNTLKKLKVTLAELVQSEKMASLGLLSAGIAHEVNNPLNFIKSGLAGFHKASKHIFQINELYQDLNKENFDSQLVKISELKTKIEYDKIINRMEKIVDNVNLGITKTSGIIQGLQDFTQTNLLEFKSYNIITGIRNSIFFLKHLFKDKIKLIENYEDIMQIECSSGHFNQLIFNLLKNAIESIDGIGTIEINVIQKEEIVEIEIKDSGKGILDRNMNKIFDPFFTTKEVGEGTGLGLTICSKIVSDHNGKITVDSSLDIGTSFKVSLPKKQRREQP